MGIPVYSDPNPATLASGSDMEDVHPTSAGARDSLAAWSVTIGAFFAMMCTMGATTSFGVFQAYYAQTILRDYPASSIAWIGGIQLFLPFALGVPAGMICEAGHMRKLVCIGSMIMLIAQVCISWCDQYWHLVLVQGVIFGIGEGAVFGPACAVVPPWFKKTRSMAMGVLATGSAVGGAALSLVARRLLDLIGFAWTMRSLALIFAVMLGVACLFIKPFPVERDRPSARLFAVAILKDPLISIYVAATCLAGAGVYLPVTYMEEYALRLGLTGDIFSYLVALTNASSIVGRLVGGWLSDKVSPHLVLLPSTAVCAVMCFCWTFCQTTPSILAFAICFGVFMGVYVALLPVGAAYIRPNDTTPTLGLLFTFVSIPSLCSLPIFGALISNAEGSGAYTNASIFGGSVLLAATVLLVLVSFVQRRRIASIPPSI